MAVTIVVEDGTGKSDANVYDTVENTDAYFVNRADIVWAAATTDNKKGAMVRSASYINAVYDAQFKGRRRTREQAMSWPRIGVIVGNTYDGMDYPVLTTDGFVIAENEIPRELKIAFYELSLRALTQDLMPDVKPGDGAQIHSKRVGEIEISYFQGGNRFTEYRYFDSLLQALLDSSPINIPLVRG